MPTVDIEYSVPRGRRSRALEVADHVLDVFGGDVDAVAIHPTNGDGFVVSVDDQPVFEGDEEYDLGEVTGAVQERL